MSGGIQLTIVGGGLAGCEAAWQAACAGLAVTLLEMRPLERSDAHQTDQLAELVCSNSLRSDDVNSSAIGLLHEEMRRAGSLILTAADKHRVPAGSALAVDREGFSREIENRLLGHPNVTLQRRRLDALPGADDGPTIIATGPLTASTLAENIKALTGEDSLAFFDAIAPVIYGDSIDFSKAWRQSRYDKGEGADYINCPLDKAQYETFIDDLLAAETIQFREWEAITPYFDGCLPIEVMAARGHETLRYGPMKPVGLTNPHSPDKPYAVVQLRQDNALGTLFNIVGFQTKMSYSAQKQVFTKIPGLENARFARLGGIHRNTFINSPRLLDKTLRLKAQPNIRFAGQITGVEGYVESAAMGLLAGRFAAAEYLAQPLPAPPPTTALGALLLHITGGHLDSGDSFQPMNINFGLLPALEKRVHKKQRKAAYSARALRDIDAWLASLPAAA